MLGHAFIVVAVICLAMGASEGAPVHRKTAGILPPDVMQGKLNHPLEGKMRTFLKNQALVPEFHDSGLTSKDYLKIINGQVKFFRDCQDESGAIIDPVEKIEWQYSTPCYALSVALLEAAGYTHDSNLLASGIKAMDHSVDDMHRYEAHGHGEFFIQPVMLALDLYEGLASDEQISTWKQKISELDPYKLYPDNLQRKQTVYNHNIVALAGEYLRAKHNLNADKDFFEKHLDFQTRFLTPLGMYRDNPGLPMVYDEFSRQYLASILVEGYRGPSYKTYRDALWRGAWTSLFMQSPFGECPTGGRSAQHIWNEAEMIVTYEIYAAQYARQRKLVEAGAFKRAAHISLISMKRWLKDNGTCYVVKNRYPIEAHHGYERYSAQSQYNLLACWLMAAAYLYADDTIQERPCPAEVGGFVVPIIEDFHKVFANAGGTYIEYDTRGDLHYNPTGLIRCHVKGSNPQLGPSDGAVHAFDKKTKEDLGGENLCTGPAWQDASGNWHRLADYDPDPPKVEVLEETPSKVRYKLTFTGDFDGAASIAETITIEPKGVTVEDVLEGGGIKQMRVYYPMLVFDGLEEAKVELDKNSVTLTQWDGSIRCELLKPSGSELKRTGVRLDHRNGQVEAVYADIKGLKAVYQIGMP